MPWIINENSSNQFCVVVEATGETVTCHDTRDDAEKHMRALYASESKARGIEVDALKAGKFVSDDPRTTNPLAHTHARKEFIASPHYEPSIGDRLRSLFKSGLRPGQTIFRGKDGKRGMFLITSNSYKDRDDETLTSKALERYAASCWKDGEFHSDNPLLWWHDNRVPMGDIIFTDFKKPFLVEVAKEMDDPIAKVLWDFAEANGDNAATSHRFGYLEEDRTEDGVFEDIVTKLESTYLPENKFAANGLTYAGVIKTMSKERDEYFDNIFKKWGGIDGASAALEKGRDTLVKKLESAGVTHKGKRNKADDVPDEDEEKADDEPSEDTPPDMDETEGKSLEDLAELLAQMQAVLMEMIDAQGGAAEAEMALDKRLKALETQQATKAKADDALTARVQLLEGKAKLAPRSVQRDQPATDINKLQAALTAAEKEAAESNLVKTPFGDLLPPINYGS